MTWFKNLKVGSKLLASFVLILVIAVFVCLYLILEMRTIDANYSDAMKLSERRISYIFEAKDHYANVRSVMREVFYPEMAADDLIRLSGQLEAELDGTAAQLNALYDISGDAIRGTINTVIPQVEEYRRDGLAIIDSLLAVGVVSVDDAGYRYALEAGQKELDRMSLAYANDMSVSIVDMSDMALSVFHGLIDENSSKASNAIVISVVLLVVMAAVALAIALYIARLISKPLIPLMVFMNKATSTGDITMGGDEKAAIDKYAQSKDEIGQVVAACSAFVARITHISNELETIASGDLTAVVDMLSDKDTMGGSLSRMVDNLGNMFGEIRNATKQVSTGSKQIADGAQALAQGSTEQAASVQQLSASISDIAKMTKDNADMAGSAASLAATIKSNAEKGSRQMGEMTSAVKEINQASQSISKVIKVIDDIAFQTNILALNAAVEAARAGQHGKGFAVVAEEVRNLAAKSAEAAKDTGGLIANSMEKAELGSRIADDTATSLAEIVSGINESSRIVGEIANSSNEQSLGIAQINTGIDQVAQVIQQNSATAQESAAASEEMSSQSNMLEDMIGQFKLRDDGSSRPYLGGPKAPAPPAAHAPERARQMFDGGAGGFGKY